MTWYSNSFILKNPTLFYKGSESREKLFSQRRVRPFHNHRISNSPTRIESYLVTNEIEGQNGDYILEFSEGRSSNVVNIYSANSEVLKREMDRIKEMDKSKSLEATVTA